jgi:hypothetical protein
MSIVHGDLDGFRNGPAQLEGAHGIAGDVGVGSSDLQPNLEVVCHPFHAPHALRSPFSGELCGVGPFFAATPIALASTSGSQSSCRLTWSRTRTSTSVKLIVLISFSLPVFAKRPPGAIPPGRPHGVGTSRWTSSTQAWFHECGFNLRQIETLRLELREILRSACGFFAGAACGGITTRTRDRRSRPFLERGVSAGMEIALRSVFRRPSCLH